MIDAIAPVTAAGSLEEEEDAGAFAPDRWRVSRAATAPGAPLVSPTKERSIVSALIRGSRLLFVASFAENRT
jgi:hypothetical protein